MRKGSLFITMFALFLSLLMLAGCGGGGSVSVKTPKGEVDIDKDTGDDSITINEGDESATLKQSKEAPTEKELGAPIYPDAEFDAENSGSVDYSSGEAAGYTGTARFTSEDSYSKVVEWYTDKIGAPISSSSTITEWLIGDMASGNYTAVQVEDSDGTTNIAITHMAVSTK